MHAALPVSSPLDGNGYGSFRTEPPAAPPRLFEIASRAIGQLIQQGQMRLEQVPEPLCPAFADTLDFGTLLALERLAQKSRSSRAPLLCLAAKRVDEVVRFACNRQLCSWKSYRQLCELKKRVPMDALREEFTRSVRPSRLDCLTALVLHVAGSFFIGITALFAFRTNEEAERTRLSLRHKFHMNPALFFTLMGQPCLLVFSGLILHRMRLNEVSYQMHKKNSIARFLFTLDKTSQAWKRSSLRQSVEAYTRDLLREFEIVRTGEWV